MLIEQELIQRISDGIACDESLLELREQLVFFRDKGMTQESMRKTLNELITDDHEDLILELLDFVEGFCSPNLDIF